MVQIRVELFLDTSELEHQFSDLVPDIERASNRARRATARRLRTVARRLLKDIAGIHYTPTVKRRISPQPRRAKFPTVWLGANPANAVSFTRASIVPGRPPGERPPSPVQSSREPEHLEIDGRAIPNAFLANPFGVPFAFVPPSLRDNWTSPLSDVVLNRGGVVSIRIEEAVQETADQLQVKAAVILREEFQKAVEAEWGR